MQATVRARVHDETAREIRQTARRQLAEHGGGPAADHRPIPRAVRADLRTLGARLAPAVPEDQLAQVLLAWTELVGSVSFEVFGHLSDAVTDPGGYFDYQMHGIGRRLGLASNLSRERRR